MSWRVSPVSPPLPHFLFPLLAAERPAYVIGAKNFSEQLILAELMSSRIEALGARVQRKESLGSTRLLYGRSLGGDIDAYVDYSGTLWTNILGRTDMPPRDQMLAELTRLLQDRYGVEVLGSLGFENAYVLAMASEKARAGAIVSIAELAAHAPDHHSPSLAVSSLYVSLNHIIMIENITFLKLDLWEKNK